MFAPFKPEIFLPFSIVFNLKTRKLKSFPLYSCHSCRLTHKSLISLAASISIVDSDCVKCPTILISPTCKPNLLSLFPLLLNRFIIERGNIVITFQLKGILSSMKLNLTAFRNWSEIHLSSESCVVSTCLKSFLIHTFSFCRDASTWSNYVWRKIEAALVLAL